MKGYCGTRPKDSSGDCYATFRNISAAADAITSALDMLALGRLGLRVATDEEAQDSIVHRVRRFLGKPPQSETSPDEASASESSNDDVIIVLDQPRAAKFGATANRDGEEAQAGHDTKGASSV